MTERREFLERIKRQVPAPGMDEMFARHERKARAERIRAGVVGLAITAGVVVGLVAAFGGLNHSVSPAAGGSEEGSPAAVAVPNMVAGQGQFYYRELGMYLGPGQGDQVYGPFVIKNWLATDGSGRLVYNPPAEGADMYGMRVEKGGYGQTHPADVVYGKDESPLSLIHLSGDPDTLLTQLEARGEPGGASPGPQPLGSPAPGSSASISDLKLMRVIFDILTDSGEMLPTPTVQAGLFEVARNMTGVTEDTNAMDPAGRPAVSLTFQIDQPPVFFFDPTTHQFLGSGWYTQDGHLLTSLVVRSEGVVDSTDVGSTHVDSLVPMVNEAIAELQP